ncbi:reversion-inducing cysteine-rich protein with Kazal motifs [Nasonia vitripennis]|uniref:Kazal-like domain-containing protein n=1 Tax=Nasonia vitripennis TaxID=7425 RepID=A0A7M7IUS9_NASVI|nr:reversion-inducing cysteine-rich protein with Kazal motifs [Nasonia vitripennis]
MLRSSMIVILLLLLLLLRDGLAEELSCCAAASGACRSVCSRVSLLSLAADSYARENATRIFTEFCPPESVEFWDCVNSTLREIERNENWTGRSCCHLARSLTCRSACATAGRQRDLKLSCRWSDEFALSDCLEQREEVEQCCSSVSNSSCRSICKELFHKSAGRRSALKMYKSKGCFHQVPKCLKGLADDSSKPSEDPKLLADCCEKAPNRGCVESCLNLIHTLGSIEEVLEGLDNSTPSCHPVKPHSPPWSCFLSRSSPSSTGTSKSRRLPLNVAKLSCCSRAKRKTCRSLCLRAFQSDWSAWQQLENQCLSSSPALETELSRCLDDSEDSCEMGCSGLSFCSKFNDKPTTLFRSCTRAADEAARWEADHWIRGGVIAGLGVPVRAAPSCPAETLRAAACLLQLRPCEARAHETRLCRDDCMDLMTSCVDWSAVRGHNAATLCAKLSPPKPEQPCISIKPFFELDNEPPRRTDIDEDINMPCRSNPCVQGQLCVVQPEERRGYRCVPGCTLGAMSNQLIPLGSWAQLSVPKHQKQEQQLCQSICQCVISDDPGASGPRLERCSEPSNCRVAESGCSLQTLNSMIVAHDFDFYLECNSCHCYDGEITCSRRSCAEPGAASLPCNCPQHYVPVCSRLGVTYASACLAKCSGLLANEVEYNSCSARDPCAARPCGPGYTCLPRPRICLTAPNHRPCEQFECVRLSPSSCAGHAHQKPVCDSENRQHSSVCAMLRSGARLGYRGPCLRGCSLRGPVCGINGETYASECAAWAERSLVDYQGPCLAVGLVSEQSRPRCGESVQCPVLGRSSCLGATPPGACCPICAGAARLFFSRKQLDLIFYQLPDSDSEDKQPVTLEAMLAALSRQLQVAECALRGSLTPEGDIFIVNQPISRRPSDLQLAACVTEIEKLVSRIQGRSPRIVNEVPLSALTRAEIAHVRIVGNAVTAAATTNSVTSLATLLIVLSLLNQAR